MLTKPCPRCGAELTAALADAIGDPRREETCPSTPQRVRPGVFGGFITGLAPAAPGTFPGSPPAAGAASNIVNMVADGMIAGVSMTVDQSSRRMASYALLADIEAQRRRMLAR